MDFDRALASKNIDLINQRDPIMAPYFQPDIMDRMGAKLHIELAN